MPAPYTLFNFVQTGPLWKPVPCPLINMRLLHWNIKCPMVNYKSFCLVRWLFIGRLETWPVNYC